MKHKYPVLKSKVWLLPFMWIYRWYDLIFIKRKSVKNYKKNIRDICTGNSSEYENRLRTVGLDFSLIDKEFQKEMHKKEKV